MAKPTNYKDTKIDRITESYLRGRGEFSADRAMFAKMKLRKLYEQLNSRQQEAKTA